MKRSTEAKILTAAVLLFLTAAAVYGQSPADHFNSFTKGSVLKVNHGIWADHLDKYLDENDPSGVNLFDYASVSGADRRALGSYLESLQKVSIKTLEKDEQMAFWINLYNALTVRVILDHYPVKSIRDISLPGSRGGPWKAPLVTVDGMKLSLDDVEHGILRPIWKDPRIHYAVNCASIGCPDLAAEPYTGSDLDSMLTTASTSYINHPRGVDRDGPRLMLSSIYNWYSEDFGSREELEGHLLKYAGPETAGKIREASGFLKYQYDWRLNEVK